MSNQSLADDLHKLIIKTFRKRKAYSFFRESIWDADLADMQLISKPDFDFCYMLLIFYWICMSCYFENQKSYYSH